MISYTYKTQVSDIVFTKDLTKGFPSGGRQVDCEVKRSQGRTRVQIINYVGGGMHCGAVATSQRCIRTYTGRKKHSNNAQSIHPC